MDDFDKTRQDQREEPERLDLAIRNLRDQLEKKSAEHHNLREAFQKSVERFRILVENNPHGIQEIDVCGTIIYANKAHHEMYGYEDGDLIGRKITDFLALASQRNELSDHLEILVKDQPAPSLYYQKIMTAHGKEKDIEVAWNYLRDAKGCVTGFISVLTDVTDRKHIKEKLETQQYYLEKAQKMGSIGTWDLDIKKNILIWTDENYRIFGLPSGTELTYETFLNCVHPDDREYVDQKWKTALIDKEPYDIEHRILAEGNIKWVREKAELEFDDNGSCVRGLGFTQDITERKRFEKTLDEARKKAEAASVTKSRFLANISHEIRTPMSVIMGVADFLDIDELADKQKSQIGLLKEASKSLLLIADDLLDVSRIEAGKLELNPAEHSLKRLLDSIESIMKPLADNKGLQFAVICSSTLPSKIYTDYGRVHQCLLNIVRNAVKFTERGHIHIKVALENKQESPHIRFDIEDTGIGIPADKLQSVFNSFTKIDEGKTRQYSGTGLGLAITKNISELLGGSVSVTSKVNKGSVFSLVIPAWIDICDKAEPVDESVSESNMQGTPRFSGKVLVADDYEGIRNLLSDLLERLGLEVTLARDGKEAVEIVLRQSFDVVFMDVQMPVLNGYAATKELREKGITIPIVALTAYAMESDRNECLEAGCDDYLSKPIGQKELKRILNKYVRS
ncbi:MAG: response regulator [Planctomycetota bacterium]|jgi:PAS domain S-box-containing protein